MRCPGRFVPVIFLAALAQPWTAPAMAEPGDRSPGGLWIEVSKTELEQRVQEEPSAFRAFELDETGLKRALASAPRELSERARVSRSEIVVPLPDGRFERFRVEESPVLDPELASRFPRFKSYRIQGVDDPWAVGRIKLSPAGFDGTILTDLGSVRIRPYLKPSRLHYVSYFEHDEPQTFEEGEPMSPALPAGAAPLGTLGPDAGGPLALERRQLDDDPALAVAGGSAVALRTFKLAVATTGEFYQAVPVGAGETQAEAVLDTVSTLVNNVNVWWERDLAIHLNLIRQTTQVFFQNSATDPYDGSCGGLGDLACILACENTAAINGQIGSGAYDVGHVLAVYAPGHGCGSFGAACQSFKGSGASRTDPTNPGVRLLAHELGHQFNARHTWTGNVGSCSPGQFDPNSAVEPGSGSTIMSYAGVCGSQSLPAISYYHIDSIEKIRTHVNGFPSCGTTSSPGNTTPVVDAGPDYTIPRNTMFTVTGTATDSQSLKYTWEQDDGIGYRFDPLEDQGEGPLFKYLIPNFAASRTFVDNDTVGEILPILDRVGDDRLTLRLTVRDSFAGAGGVTSDTIRVTVQGNPFRVTYPNGGEFLTSPNVTVTWNAGGGAPPVSDSVNILYSHAGANYEVLLSDTPNDGSQSLTLPCPSTLNGRIRIEAADNIFFDTSDAGFTFLCPCPTAQGCGGCFTDTEECSGYDTRNTACWNGTEAVYCEDGTSIIVTNCDCYDPSVGNNGGGNQHIEPSCGENQSWSCPVVPACPAEDDCGSHECTPAEPECTLADTGEGACVRADNTLLACPPGQTVHVQECECGGEGDPMPLCPASSTSLTCL